MEIVKRKQKKKKKGGVDEKKDRGEGKCEKRRLASRGRAQSLARRWREERENMEGEMEN